MENIENSKISRWVAAIERARPGSKNQKKLSYLIRLATRPKRSRPSVNIDKLEKLAKENDSIIIPGKVLGAGSISKKLNICAVDFTNSAIEKLKGSGCRIVSIEDAIKDKASRIII